ncbi:hypothetical protein [Streptomyces otsuchiensis]|uniref:hypothetical protein n=1 Tax=Streptomyces otsuchiensis TaxID=2681388 RepID=UPI00103172B2|nr:hypothetical protein [Streptomyces otsuchiensis]
MSGPGASYRLWADAHRFYDTAHLPGQRGQGDPTQAIPFPQADPLATLRADWSARLAAAPNGALLHDNALFSALRSDRTLHLLHVTNALEEINGQGVLYPSGGCLVGSVYCAPLTDAGGGEFRMHNLGHHILTREAPESAARAGRPEQSATPLIIEVTVPDHGYRGLAGIDYLRLGTIHLELYDHLKYLLSRAERHELRETVVARTRNATALLALATARVYQGAAVTPEHFLSVLHETIPRLPVLGYLYFEALSEYLMLHSTSDVTRRLAARGEMNNRLYKELLVLAHPDMRGRFDLSRFRPAPRDLDGLLGRVDPTLEPSAARAHLVDRVSYLVAARLFTPGLVPSPWHHTRWEFDTLAARVGPLVGHLVHRELRNFGRYRDFYVYFDQNKAIQAWNYWNHLDVVVPFNGTVPKGEVGVNPAYPGLEYTIWRAEPSRTGHLRPVSQLDLTISPRLVDLRHTLMRGNRDTPADAPPGPVAHAH